MLFFLRYEICSSLGVCAGIKSSKVENEVNAQKQILIKKAHKIKKCFSAVGSSSEQDSGCVACTKLHISAGRLGPPAVCSQQKSGKTILASGLFSSFFI